VDDPTKFLTQPTALQWYTELTPDERKVFVEESRAKFGVTGADE